MGSIHTIVLSFHLVRTNKEKNNIEYSRKDKLRDLQSTQALLTSELSTSDSEDVI